MLWEESYENGPLVVRLTAALHPQLRIVIGDAFGPGETICLFGSRTDEIRQRSQPAA